MHVDGLDHQEATTASMVAELWPDRPPVVHHTLGSPCRTPQDLWTLSTA
jgi:hypothetical protein